MNDRQQSVTLGIFIDSSGAENLARTGVTCHRWYLSKAERGAEGSIRDHFARHTFDDRDVSRVEAKANSADTTTKPFTSDDH